MQHLKNILVAVDFSEHSASALHQARRLARLSGATLRVVHVLESMVIEELAQVMDLPRDQTERETRENVTTELAQWLREEGLEEDRYELEVFVGKPLDMLLRQIKASKIDLLVMGLRGAHSEPGDVGSLALRCARKADCKVLLVRSRHHQPFRKLLATIDFSDVSDEVIEQATRTATAEDAEIDFLHVYYPPWRRLHYMAPTRQASPKFQKQYLQALRARLDALLEPLRERGLRFQAHLVECDRPSEGIVEFAREHGSDLVLLGASGRSGLRYMLLGSTAEHVLHHAETSILTLRNEDFQFDVEGKS